MKTLIRKLGSHLPFTRTILRFLVKFLPKYILVNLSEIKIYINPRDIRNLIDAVLPDKKTRNRMCELFSFLLKEDHIVLDVGGNIGLFTIIASKKSKKVHVFEPVLECVENIQKNIDYHSMENVILNDSALSNENGIQTFYKDRDYSILGSFSKENIMHEPIEVKIKTIKLDEYIKKENIETVNIIKLNIQGAEGYAVDGGKELISRDLPIVLTEFWPYGLNSAGYSPNSLISFFKELDYEFTEFKPSTLELTNRNSKDLDNICKNLDISSIYYFVLQNPKSKTYYEDLGSLVAKEKYNGLN